MTRAGAAVDRGEAAASVGKLAPVSSVPLLKTPLHARHGEAGARLVPFAGWEMPVQYQGVIEEHVAVRTSVGVFDVSHMGQIRTVGTDALSFLQRLTTNDVERIPVDGAQYGLLCADDGGVLDDLFTYRVGESEFLTVTNAGNHPSDLARFREVAEGFNVEVADEAATTAMLAVQGPAARTLLRSVSEGELPPRMKSGKVTIAGRDVFAAGTGYTGEDGLEILARADDAEAVWDAVVAAGAVPCGLASRDTLRTEACYHLYGNDLDTGRNPIEAGLGWACKEETGFIGSEAVAAFRDGGTAEVLTAFAMTGPGIARAGSPVVGGGSVSSGTFSPTFEQGIGMAYVPVAMAVPGTEIEIDVRGKIRTAEVREKPLYRKAD